eukprot:scaffold340610_cov35-Prasinocladus_malaysianus.AAC.1
MRLRGWPVPTVSSDNCAGHSGALGRAAGKLRAGERRSSAAGQGRPAAGAAPCSKDVRKAGAACGGISGK